ncbi:MAG TPA: ABC transporter permease [Blastocatellia bacterium]|nr:ABC transporter permease [Blastocatellia bacterium]
MDWKNYVREHLTPLDLGPEREVEMVDEMAQHLEAVYEEALTDGASEGEAFARAAAHVKDWQLLECELIRAKHPITGAWLNRRLTSEARNDSRGRRGGAAMGSLTQDLRYAARMLLNSKAFTSIAVLSLALGIGANTALFSLVDAVLLKTLPVKKPNELVVFQWQGGPRGLSRGIMGSTKTDPATGMRTSTSFSYLTFERIRDNNETLADVFAFAPLHQLNVSVDGQPEIASGQFVSGGYYPGLGVRAVIGRTLTPDDDRAGATPVAVITHRYWQSRFAADQEAVGKTVNVNNVSFTIVGVTPAGFVGASEVGWSPDVSIPFSTQERVSPHEPTLNGPWFWWLQIMGRLNPGVTQEQAAASFENIFQQSAQEGWTAAMIRFPPTGQAQNPAPRDVPKLVAASGSQGLTDLRAAYSQPLSILMAIVGFVLLIACANVANLLLARAATRQKEIAVRLAIGAGRWRLVRQLLTESVLLAILGGALGVLFAYWGKDLLLTLRPWGGGQLDLDLNLDMRVLGFTLAISLATGLLFGIAPALKATRVDLTSALKDTARSTSGGSRSFLTKSLIVVQVAMSVVLLVGAGLFVRTLRNLQNVDLGFNRENLLLFSVEPGLNGYDRPQMAQLYRRMTERLEAVPGVRSATVSLIPLLSGQAQTRSIDVQGYTPQPGSEHNAKVNTVGASFFKTMEMPILLGRDLSTTDEETAPRVAVINQLMADKYFGDENPIGRRFGFGGPETAGQIEIVGLTQNAKYTDMRSETQPTIYLPYLQSIPRRATFIVRTSGNAAAMATPIREAMHEVDSNLPLSDVKTQSQQADDSLRQERLFATLSSFFGVLALLLACIGLYGVMSYGVARRTNEIGIRMALGASAPRVTRMVMRETMVVVLIGIALGLGGAVATTRLISAMLFGLAPTDPVTISFAILLMVGVAALAGYLPARRAAKVDPMIALRYE